jgi:hypothetical protein
MSSLYGGALYPYRSDTACSIRNPLHWHTHHHTHHTPDLHTHTYTHIHARASVRGRAVLDPVPRATSCPTWTVDQIPPNEREEAGACTIWAKNAWSTLGAVNRPEEEASFHCETSDKDNLWAVETPVPQGADSPLDVLLPAYGDDAAAEAFWARLRAEAPSRKLGEANARVACSLLFATDTPLEAEAEAAAELQATGWVEWVNRCLPGEGSLLCPPRLPPALIAHVRATPLRPCFEALSAGLAVRAACSSS